MAWLLSKVIPRGVFTARHNFSIWEKRGFHITPVRFYSPIPDLRAIPEETWTTDSEMPGIDMRVDAQLALLEQIRSHHLDFQKNIDDVFDLVHRRKIRKNFPFGTPDAEAYMCMIRHFQPRRIIEIGCGMSTYLAAHTITSGAVRGSASECELTAIEPYPTEALRQGFPGLTRLIDRPVQKVPFSVFQELRENDILFIDSSHFVRVGSDVEYEYLEVIPRLNPGVVIHVHDIFFPRNYPREWIVDRHHFCNEQYVLQAFLAFNHSFEIVLSSNYMKMRHPAAFHGAFPNTTPEHTPGSFWFRRTR
jgi:hypothetical protein